MIEDDEILLSEFFLLQIHDKLTKRASGVFEQSTSIKYLDINYFVYGEISTKRLLEVCLPYEPSCLLVCHNFSSI